MRINISFNEAAKYTFESSWYYKRNDSELMNNTGAELVNIIQEDYFNGADKAVLYIGYSNTRECFEFELIPNN